MPEFDIHNEHKEWAYRPLLGLIVSLLLIFFAWAYFSHIDQQVKAHGNIIPSGQSKLVQHLEGGIVDQILVAEGQRVEKNQPLFQIRNQRAASDLQGGKIALKSLKIKLARLQAEYDGAEDFIYKASTDEESDEGLSNIINNEERLFRSRQQEFLGRLQGLKEQEKQKSLKLSDLGLQNANVTKEREIALDQFKINERLRKSGAISESKYLESKGRVSDFNTQLGKISKAIPIVRAELQEVRQNISEQSEKRRTEILDEINKVEVDRQRLEENLKADYDEVQRRALLSPVTGMINKIYVNTIGGVVRPGEPLAEIVPLNENLIVEARIATKDRGLIWVGLPASINVTAYDPSIYGNLKGKITDISADSFVEEGVGQFYRVRIALDADSVKGFEPIYPGMTVQANILSGKVSILQAILKPILKLQKNALREP